MPRKKPATPDPHEITVAELLLALATFPQDATLSTTDPFVEVGVLVAGEWHPLIEWHAAAQRYERPDVVVQEVQRSDAGEEFAIANEFLAYLRTSSISLVHDGQGHNETASPLLPATRARLAEEFATRETKP